MTVAHTNKNYTCSPVNTIERYVGVPLAPEIRPLKGTWGPKGTYEIKVNLQNIYLTMANIEYFGSEVSCFVKWRFPVLNKDMLIKHLANTPESSFQVIIKKVGDLFTVKINAQGPGLELEHEAEKFFKELNAESCVADHMRLTLLHNYICQTPEKQKLLTELIAKAKKNPQYKTALGNLEAIAKAKALS